MASTPKSLTVETHTQVPAPPTEPPAPMTAMPKLKASGMNFYYGAFQALKDINLQVETNRITALIGPSGCGKVDVSPNA